MHYDTLLALGIGIREDGSLPDSAKALVRKAVELIKQDVASKVIFSGRWSYTLHYTPPISEAEAMSNYATSLGLDSELIFIEKESTTTTANLCLLKEQYVEPNQYNSILLVSLKELAQRTLFNAAMVFGPTYKIDVAYADFSYSEEKTAQLTIQEEAKLIRARQFHSTNQPGDHLAIFQAATKDLKENY